MTSPSTIPPIVLASTSPRRAQLLREAGWTFEQRSPDFDDSHADLCNASPIRAAEALAYLKACSVADAISSGIVIGSDTVLIVDGRMIGKPRDVNDARAILGRLFDRAHAVCTAVAIVDAAGDSQRIFHDITTVAITHPGEAELQAYLADDQWRGKAGGYNLAELDDRWRFQITGDPSTVIGLPMRRLAQLLPQFKNSSPPGGGEVG